MSIRKPSLFSQQMNLKPKLTDPSGPVIQGIREKSLTELEQLEKDSLAPIPPAQIPEIFHSPPPDLSKNLPPIQEDPKIHEENLKKLNLMSKAELQDSLKEIQSTLNPSTVEFLRKRGEAKQKKQQKHQIKDLQEDQIEALQQIANSTCMHIPVFKCDLDKIRFDYEGNEVQKYINNQWQGNSQGFTLREITNLLRSTIPSQRSLAAESLSILLSSDFKSRIQFSIEECELARVLVFTLTEKNFNILTRVLSILSLIFEKNSSKNWKIQKKEEFLFPSVESSKNFLIPKAVRDCKGIWEEEETRNSVGFFSEPGKDFVVDLLTYGLLDILANLEGFDIAGIVLGICLHSVSACYVVVRHSVFEKLIRDAPGSYRVLEILAKSSLPAAHKISQNLPQRFFNDLLIDESSIGLLFSLFVHKQVFDIRVIAFEKIEQGSSAFISVISRLIQSHPTNEYIGIAELVYYKYLISWEEYKDQPELLSNSLNLIVSYLNSGIKVNYNLSKLQEAVKNIILSVKFESNLSFVDTGDKVVVNNLELFFRTEELENGVYKQIKLLISCLRFIVETRKSGEGLSFFEIEGVVGEFKSKVVNQLKEILGKLVGYQAVPKIICYRFKELVCFLVNCFEFLQIVSRDDVFTVIPFLGSCDEVVFINLIGKVFDSIPEFFKGYLYSDKNLSLSIAYHERSCKVPSFFAGLNENPYFPLPFDWLFAPLSTADKQTVELILQFFSNLTTINSNYPLSGIIADLNGFFIRSDQLYLEVLPHLEPVLTKVTESKYFGQGVNQVKNSILNTTREFVSNSYLEKVYTKWVLSFMSDDVDSDIFKDVLDELEFLLTRLPSATNNEFLGPTDSYKKLKSSLKLE